ncbi:MAG: hypothetical protein C4329_01000 [Chitinophagaceae bacterium]
MKITLTCILAIFLAFLISSCAKEYSYEGGGTLANARKCIACSYLPICDSSTFVYVDSNGRRIDTTRGTATILNDTTVNGITYTKVAGYATFGQGLWYNCANGDYKVLLSLSGFGINIDSIVHALLQTVQSPIPIPSNLIQVPDKFRTSILKTTLPVGGAWRDTIYSLSFPPLISIFLGLDYKILEKGVTRTVFNHTYNNVIHVQAKMAATLPAGINIPLTYTMDYYFSQDVGLIEAEAKNGTTLMQNSRLFAYHL